eukprot:GHVH01017400.1.p1 GENE.GHVH01017400.1~~GHVH01017400.1.p1  ORF type:complete len:151 (+),score=5.03 GHVH01017400.1:67-519(+)
MAKGNTPLRSPFGLVRGGVSLKAGGNRTLFPHGNYAKYYSSRRRCVSKEVLWKSGSDKACQSTATLPRDLRLMSVNEAVPGGFKDHTVLDIGCNEGLLPLEIGGLYEARWVEGVDIDILLIKTANRQLREIRRQVGLILTFSFLAPFESY